MKYEKTQLYEMNVTGSVTDGHSMFYIIDDQDTKYRVRMREFQKSKQLPSVVYCRVCSAEADGTPVFQQDRFKLLSDIYTIGNKYPFKVGKRCKSSWRNRDLYVITDKYGFSCKIPVLEKESLPEGKRIECKIRAITTAGTLQLQPDSIYISSNDNYISYEQLLVNVSLEELPEVSFHNLKKNRSVDMNINHLFKQYERRHGLWVISYLTLIAIRRKDALACEDFSLFTTYNDFYLKLAEWVVENSDFLSVYPLATKTSLRQHIEREMYIANIQRKAIALIRLNRAEAYVTELINKIRISGFICNRDIRINIIACIITFNPEILVKDFSGLMSFILYLMADPNKEYIQTIGGIINKLIRERVNEQDRLLHVGGIKNTDTNYLHTIVQLLSLSLLLNNNKETDLRVHRSILYRYLSYIDDAKYTTLFMMKSLNALVCTGGYQPEFKWNDIQNFNPLLFAAKVRSFINSAEQLNVNNFSCSTTWGTLLLRGKKFVITPVSLLSATTEKLFEIVSLFDGRINVELLKKEKKEWNKTANLLTLRKQWDSVLTLFDTQKAIRKSALKTHPSVGDSLLVKVQAVRKSYPLMVFADIIDEYHEGTGVLFVSDVCRYYIESLENTFLPDDVFRVTVKNVAEGKIGFSIIDELAKMTSEHVNQGDYFQAKLIRASKSKYTWLTDEGFCVYTNRTGDLSLSIGATAWIEIVTVTPDGYIDAVYIEELDAVIDETDALNALIDEYINQEDDLAAVNEIISSNKLRNVPDENETQETTGTEPEITLQLIEQEERILEELIYITGRYASVEPDAITRYSYMGIVRLLSHISGYENSAEYYGLKMSYQELLYQFVSDPAGDELSKQTFISNDLLKKYPDMDQCNLLLSLLACWNKEDCKEHLLHYASYTDDNLISGVSRLVLSNNLLIHVAEKMVLDSLRKELAGLLGMTNLIPETKNQTQEMLPARHNLGLENETLEFKSSVVYPAGKVMEADMAFQMNVIMKTIAGFLNASGGTLYIGVHDTGDVMGLKNDFEYMKCGADGYERFIRSRIVNVFGKDINSLIIIRFETFDNNSICKIMIPQYEKLVRIDNIFWQRQGNETRILEGVSLTLQEERKQILKQNSNIKFNLDKFGHLLLDTIQNPTETTLAVALKAGIGKITNTHKEKKIAKQKHLLATSLIRVNPVNKKDENFGIDVVTYLSFVENGEYLLTDDLPKLATVILTLAIKENEQDSYIILCYDNGYVNKVPVKMMLSKKRKYCYKNGMFKNARLMFASIASDTADILVRSEKNQAEYVKLMSVGVFSEYSDLLHKGTPAFSFDFGSVLQWDVMPAEIKDNFSRIHNDSLSYQGVPLTAEGFTEDMNLMAEYCPILTL